MVLGNDQTGGGGSPGKEFGDFEKREEMVGWLGNWQLSACPPPPVPWSRGEFNGKLKVGIILYLPPFSPPPPSPPIFPKSLNEGFRGGICIEKWS